MTVHEYCNIIFFNININASMFALSTILGYNPNQFRSSNGRFAVAPQANLFSYNSLSVWLIASFGAYNSLTSFIKYLEDGKAKSLAVLVAEDEEIYKIGHQFMNINNIVNDVLQRTLPAPPKRPGLPAPPERPGLPAPPERPGLPAPPKRPGLPAPPERPGLPAPPKRPGLPSPPERPNDILILLCILWCIIFSIRHNKDTELFESIYDELMENLSVSDKYTFDLLVTNYLLPDARDGVNLLTTVPTTNPPLLSDNRLDPIVIQSEPPGTSTDPISASEQGTPIPYHVTTVTGNGRVAMIISSDNSSPEIDLYNLNLILNATGPIQTLEDAERMLTEETADMTLRRMKEERDKELEDLAVEQFVYGSEHYRAREMGINPIFHLHEYQEAVNAIKEWVEFNQKEGQAEFTEILDAPNITIKDFITNEYTPSKGMKIDDRLYKDEKEKLIKHCENILQKVAQELAEAEEAAALGGNSKTPKIVIISAMEHRQSPPPVPGSDPADADST